MKVAFIIYEGMTALDFVGLYDPLTRLKTMGFIPDLFWEVCALDSEVRDGAGLVIKADRVGEPLSGYDLVAVPGGFGSRKLVKDETFVNWLSTAAACPLKVSVCTGSLLFGAAGFLQGRAATTHPAAYGELRPFCAAVREDRVVEDGEVISARGVTSAIDLGLYLCEKLAGREAAEKIRRQMDYLG